VHIIKVIVVLWVLIFIPEILQIKFNNHEVIVDKNFNEKEVILNLLDTLVIKLEVQFSTGYIWKIRRYDQNLVLLNNELLKLQNSIMIGGTENQIFRFIAIQPGKAKIELKYVRPWKQKDSFSQTFKLKVFVKKE
jgi:predicted secreted protein